MGTPLKDWDIQINYGIKTGYNDAFIISTEKRNEILANCKTEEERRKTEELIRPILRGRDIKRYGYEWADLWLINTHNGVKERIPRIRIEDYPAVKAHLDQFWDKIKDRADQGDTPYNLRNCAYLEEFSKPKICWASVGQTSYSLIPPGYLLLDTNYFFAIDSPYYLLILLNSKLVTWWINTEDTPIGSGGAFRHYKYNLQKLSLPKFIPELNNYNLKAIDKVSIYDNIINRYFRLTETEIQFIEDYLADTESCE